MSLPSFTLLQPGRPGPGSPGLVGRPRASSSSTPALAIAHMAPHAHVGTLSVLLCRRWRKPSETGSPRAAGPLPASGSALPASVSALPASGSARPPRFYCQGLRDAPHLRRRASRLFFFGLFPRRYRPLAARSFTGPPPSALQTGVRCSRDWWHAHTGREADAGAR